MSYLRDHVIVLKKEPFREQDRRVVMYGEEHGLLMAVARGSSLKDSKQAGHLEPFTEAEVMIAKGKVFDKLAVARSRGSEIRIPRRLSSYVFLGAFSDLVTSLTRPGMSDHRLFDLLQEVRAVSMILPEDLTIDRARFLLAGATLKLLDLVGFAPALEEEDREEALPPQSLTLLKFLRRFPLADALRVTTTTDVLRAASGFIEDAVRHTPLEHPPHGPATVRILLTPTR